MAATDNHMTEAADRVRAAVAEFNDAAAEATRQGLKAELLRFSLQMVEGVTPSLTVRGFERR
jgi:hypothetical protein